MNKTVSQKCAKSVTKTLVPKLVFKSSTESKLVLKLAHNPRGEGLLFVLISLPNQKAFYREVVEMYLLR